jgi:hypothetical protein
LKISVQARLGGKRFTLACYNELILRAVSGAVKKTREGRTHFPGGGWGVTNIAKWTQQN